MKSMKFFTFVLILGIVLSACIPTTPLPSTPVILPTPAATGTLVPTALPTETATPASSPTTAWTPTAAQTATTVPTPAVSPTVPNPERPPEVIYIREPASGSRVVSPIRVAGIADPTFEQNLVIRVLTDDGTEISLIPTTIQADVGQRGEYEAEIPLELTEERNLFIQVYSTSARDGGITHLNSVGVIFSPGGPEEIQNQSEGPEQIAIFQPLLTETVQGGTVHVEGFALASFEQTLLVEVLDDAGNVVGSQPITVQAPDLGVPGPFSADVPYSISAAGPGRVVVRDVSPAHGDNSHLSSVEINLEP